MTSECLYHTSCPACNSRDNLGVYSDHVWCFGCGYLRRTEVSAYIPHNNKEKQRDVSVSLPLDYSPHVSLPNLLYHLDNYEITADDIYYNRIGESREGVFLKKRNIHIKPLLVFPFFDRMGKLMFWQGRNFGDEGPKWYTKGNKAEYAHLMIPANGRTDIIVLVEDIISAIKVGKHFLCIPLFGTYLSDEVFYYILGRKACVIVWLDADKKTTALGQAKRLSQFTKAGAVVNMEGDPKDYKNKEIYDYVNRFVQQL